MYIKDLMTGEVRLYGTNHHDALEVSSDGRTLSYENLQNGEGSRYGDYRFCDKDGKTPEEDEDLIKHGADAYFNIGGFFPHEDEDLEKIKSEICDKYCKYPHEYADQDEMIDDVCVCCPLLRLDDVKGLEVKKDDK